jgi:hypothetical protein
MKLSAGISIGGSATQESRAKNQLPNVGDWPSPVNCQNQQPTNLLFLERINDLPLVLHIDDGPAFRLGFFQALFKTAER